MTNPVTTDASTDTAADSSKESLWPDLAAFLQNNPVELPVDILQSQARLLAPQTEYLLKGVVRSSELQNIVQYHSFYIYAPYVRAEPFKLFYIKHGVDVTGSIVFVWGEIGPSPDQEIGTPIDLDHLRPKLQEVLADKNVLLLIRNLLTMSKSAKADGLSNAAIDDSTDEIED